MATLEVADWWHASSTSLGCSYLKWLQKRRVYPKHFALDLSLARDMANQHKMKSHARSLGLCQDLRIVESRYHTTPGITPGLLESVEVVAKATNFNLRSLSVHLNSPITNEVLQTISKFCPRLQNLDLNFAKTGVSPHTGVEFMFRMCTNLRMVKIVGCSVHASKNNLLPSMIVKLCKSLVHLEVKWCFFGAQSEAVNSYDLDLRESKLEVLDFGFCFNLSLGAFKGIVESCRKTLRKFHLGQYPLSQFDPTVGFLNEIELPNLVDFVLQLAHDETVEKSTASDLSRFFAKAHKLEAFSMPNCSRLGDEALIKVAECPNLKVLDVRNCTRISSNSIFPILSRCQKLEEIHISGCPQIPISVLEMVLSSCRRLKALSYGDAANGSITSLICNENDSKCRMARGKSGVAVPGQRTSNFEERLEHLRINDCTDLKDEAIISLIRMCRNLTTVDLSGCTKLSDASIIALVKNCPKLISIQLQGCNISDTSVEAIALLCARLKSINISHCERVTDLSIALLSRCCLELSSIDIIGTRLGGRAIQELAANCKSMAVLRCDIDKLSYASSTKFSFAYSTPIIRNRVIA